MVAQSGQCCISDFELASLTAASSFDCSRFLKKNVFSQSQVDPDSSQTLAT